MTPDPLSIGCLQLELLHCFWGAGKPLTIREIEVAVNDAREKPLAYTTLLTVARNLVKRGLVRQTGGKKQHVFSAVVSREDFFAVVGQAFADRFFAGDVTAAARYVH